MKRERRITSRFWAIPLAFGVLVASLILQPIAFGQGLEQCLTNARKLAGPASQPSGGLPPSTDTKDACAKAIDEAAERLKTMKERLVGKSPVDVASEVAKDAQLLGRVRDACEGQVASIVAEARYARELVCYAQEYQPVLKESIEAAATLKVCLEKRERLRRYLETTSPAGAPRKNTLSVTGAWVGDLDSGDLNNFATKCDATPFFAETCSPQSGKTFCVVKRSGDLAARSKAEDLCLGYDPNPQGKHDILVRFSCHDTPPRLIERKFPATVSGFHLSCVYPDTLDAERTYLTTDPCRVVLP